MKTIPFVCLFEQLDKAFSSMQIEGMKTVEHEDKEFNNDYSVDPLADPRLDKMDLFGMVDSKDRDVIMNASSSFVSGPADSEDLVTVNESSSDSGSGE